MYEQGAAADCGEHSKFRACGLQERLEQCVSRVQQLREADMVGAVLWRDQSRATEYFSR